MVIHLLELGDTDNDDGGQTLHAPMHKESNLGYSPKPIKHTKLVLALFPGHSQILSRSSGAESWSGLGTRLVFSAILLSFARGSGWDQLQYV